MNIAIFFLVLGTGVIGAVVIFLITIYNRFVRLRRETERAWANIDVLLKQRHDEIPNLVGVCKGYMKHEQGLLVQLTKYRSGYLNASNQHEKVAANQLTMSALHGLMAVVENYPNLQADEHFLKLQGRLSEVEDMIADRRELYNSSVTIYNIRREQFPYNIIATWFKFDTRDLLKTEEEFRLVPRVATAADALNENLNKQKIYRWLEKHKSQLLSFDINQDKQIDLDEISWAYNAVVKFRELTKDAESTWYIYQDDKVSEPLVWGQVRELLKDDIGTFICADGFDVWLPFEVITI